MGLFINPNLGRAVSVAIATGYDSSKKRYVEQEMIFLPGAALPKELSPRLVEQYNEGDPHLNHIFVSNDNGVEHDLGENVSAIPVGNEPVVPDASGATPNAPVNPSVIGESADSDVDDDEDSDENDSSYADWNKEDLVEELKSRNLPASGNKPELIDRLNEDDNTRASQVTPDNPFA